MDSLTHWSPLAMCEVLGRQQWAARFWKDIRQNYDFTVVNSTSNCYLSYLSYLRISVPFTVCLRWAIRHWTLKAIFSKLDAALTLIIPLLLYYSMVNLEITHICEHTSSAISRLPSCRQNHISQICLLLFWIHLPCFSPVTSFFSTSRIGESSVQSKLENKILNSHSLYLSLTHTHTHIHI